MTFLEKQEDDDVISWGIPPRTARCRDYVYHKLGLKVKFVCAYKVPTLLDEEIVHWKRRKTDGTQ